MRTLETFTIEIVQSKDVKLTRPYEYPSADHVIGYDSMQRIRMVFNEMANDLNAKVRITRHIHIWCANCNAYIGYKTIPYREMRNPTSRTPVPFDELMPHDIKTHRAECLACRHESCFTIQDPVQVLY